MITFGQIKKTAREAYMKNELFEFITGRNGYDLPVIDVPINVPTDWTRIIANGIYEIYEDEKEQEIVSAYEEAIIRAINNSETDLWSAVNVLYFQIKYENMKKAPFSIDKKVLNGLKERIIECKEILQNNYPNGDDGLSMYEDILRLNHNFKNNWGYSFIE